MGIFDVNFGEMEVTANHIEGRVAEESLEGVDIAAVAKKLDGKGVAEAVGMGVGDISAGAEVVEQVADGITIHGVVFDGEEKGFGIVGFVAGGKVAVDLVGSTAGDEDGAGTGFFARTVGMHLNGAVIKEIDITDGEAGSFGDTEAGIEEEFDKGNITGGGGAFHLEGFTAMGNGGAGVFGGFEEGLDIFLGEGDDFGGGFGRAFDFGVG